MGKLTCKLMRLQNFSLSSPVFPAFPVILLIFPKEFYEEGNYKENISNEIKCNFAL